MLCYPYYPPVSMNDKLNGSPRVLVLMGHYLPGYKVGGPLVSILNMVNALKANYAFSVLTCNQDFGTTEQYPDIPLNKWLMIGPVPVCYVRKSFLGYLTLIRHLRKNTSKETVIYLNSVFNSMFTIGVLLARRMELVQMPHVLIAPRGELFEEALGFKPWKKRLFLVISRALGLYKGVVWHATTELEKKHILKNMLCREEQVRVASLIATLDAPSVRPDDNTTAASDALRVVYLSRISKDKNTPFVFEVLSRVQCPVVLDVYGPIEDEDIWAKCLAIAEQFPAHICFEYKGYVPKNQVKTVLATYDLFFLPTFAENYGHAIAESLLSGTPVLISDNTPWQNLAKSALGWDIPLQHIDEFVQIIDHFYQLSPKEKQLQRIQRQKEVYAMLADKQIVEDNIQLFKLPFP